MMEPPEQYNATAYNDGEQTGQIEDAPSGNIIEFVHAHLEGSPFTPEVLADKVVVERSLKVEQ